MFIRERWASLWTGIPHEHLYVLTCFGVYLVFYRMTASREPVNASFTVGMADSVTYHKVNAALGAVSSTINLLLLFVYLASSNLRSKSEVTVCGPETLSVALPPQSQPICFSLLFSRSQMCASERPSPPKTFKRSYSTRSAQGFWVAALSQFQKGGGFPVGCSVLRFFNLQFMEKPRN